MRFIAALAALPLALAAPIISPLDAEVPVVPGSYIVVLKDNADKNVVSAAADRVLSALGGAPKFSYDLEGFRGFAINADDALIGTIAALSEVDYIEKDTIVTTQRLVTESGAPYGLGRISHRNKGTTDYVYDSSAGSGTYAYIIDTGIFTGHPQFGGRATFGYNAVGDGNNNDGNGHGTHVAGTVGSRSYGVAKNVQLIAVKVLGSNGSGSNSGVIAGINWAANDSRSKGRAGKAVANMSLGGRKSQATNNAAASAVRSGLFMAVAAGNSRADAANFSPASEPTVCTVAASDENDAFASFSNYGSLVDIIAPGVRVLSTWNDGKTKTISGTSMATPHIAGLGAYLLALHGSRSPIALCDYIKNTATKGKVTGVPANTINAIGYNGSGR